GSTAAAMRALPCSAPTKIAGRITIVIHTFVPSANATTSANVRHRRSVLTCAIAIECTSRVAGAPVVRGAGRHLRPGVTFARMRAVSAAAFAICGVTSLGHADTITATTTTTITIDSPPTFAAPLAPPGETPAHEAAPVAPPAFRVSVAVGPALGFDTKDD